MTQTKINYRNPTLIGLVASAGLTALVIIGSRNLEHFDSALFGSTDSIYLHYGIRDDSLYRLKKGRFWTWAKEAHDRFWRAKHG